MRQFWTILILLSSQFTLAMEDLSDFLVYNGDTLEIRDFPLRDYFNTQTKPDFLFVTEIDREYLLKSYSAYWTVRNDSLFLTKIFLSNGTAVSPSRIFKMSSPNKLVHASWYDNSIWVPSESQIAFNQTEYERFFEFRQGILHNIVENHYTVYKYSEYADYGKKFSDHVRNEMDISSLELPPYRVSVIVEISSVTLDGKIDSVSVRSSYNTKVDNEALRIVKSIPEWTVIYKNGKPYNKSWFVPIYFNRKE